MQKKAQISIEYLVTFGLAFLFLIGIVYIFLQVQRMASGLYKTIGGQNKVIKDVVSKDIHILDFFIDQGGNWSIILQCKSEQKCKIISVQLKLPNETSGAVEPNRTLSFGEKIAITCIKSTDYNFSDCGVSATEEGAGFSIEILINYAKISDFESMRHSRSDTWDVIVSEKLIPPTAKIEYVEGYDPEYPTIRYLRLDNNMVEVNQTSTSSIGIICLAKDNYALKSVILEYWAIIGGINTPEKVRWTCRGRSGLMKLKCVKSWYIKNLPKGSYNLKCFAKDYLNQEINKTIQVKVI